MIRTRVEQSLFIPGLGHPVHKDGDPRTPVLSRIAAEAGVLGNSLRLLEAIDRIHPKFLGRRLPVNGAGVCGAALADIGIPPHLTRGVSLVARSAGLLGHIAEELRSPIGQQVYDAVDRNAEYSPVTVLVGLEARLLVAGPGMTDCPCRLHDPGGVVTGCWWRWWTADRDRAARTPG